MSRNISEIFGSMVFNDDVMMRRLPHETYKALRETRENGCSLDPQIANVVANAMKDWAIEKGATHFTHWFQPMTGITAEKHDSFISPTAEGKVIMEFSGKELIKGEPDASSFPSGGLRATFEARGYTSWDPTSNAFIKDGTLCIPTAFCSFTGDVLDKKTPLLRSMEALNHQALRILRLFGHTDVKHVYTTAGPEQEYFLVDRAVYEKRPDLKLTGRTLIGARSPKGQELEDHYFGALKPRVSAFMAELDEELWKIGVLAKTKHNETAPAQHELAPIFTTTNIACDHNQLTMEMMKKVALKHDLVCLLHEKPFKGVNGSGKHNNWSMSTDTGRNLLDPGELPAENAQFLLFLVAVISAVDKYADLLCAVTASAGNEQRLGGNEAPPSIISMFIGDELSGILDAVEHGYTYALHEKSKMEIGVTVLPSFPKDSTDRNRTSPIAFTGNKFEFRSVGSSMSIAGPNIVLNTIVADELMEFADILECAEDFNIALNELLKRSIKEHKRIIFNGNNYTAEWIKEAEKRGLSAIRNTVDALNGFASLKNVEVCVRHGIFTEQEMMSRREIQLAGYAKVKRIEALTLLDMVRREILPAMIGYSSELSEAVIRKNTLSLPVVCEQNILENISLLTRDIFVACDKLDMLLTKVPDGDAATFAAYMRDMISPVMDELRELSDRAELRMPKSMWPYPSYEELLFGV